MQLTFTILKSPDPTERGQTRMPEMTNHDSLAIESEHDARVLVGSGWYVSQRQVIIEIRGQRYIMRDLDIRNKTFIRRGDTPDTPQSWHCLPARAGDDAFNGDCLRSQRSSIRHAETQ